MQMNYQQQRFPQMGAMRAMQSQGLNYGRAMPQQNMMPGRK
jgi:hypothetical protein